MILARRAYREWLRRSPWFAGLALAHVALAAVLALLSVGDLVQVMGVGQWVKPIKFCLSIALYLGALAWFAPSLGAARIRRVAWIAIGTSMVVEIAAIVTQAARGARSHFNIATAFDAGIFSLMGFAILVNTVALAWVGWLAYRAWQRERTGYHRGILLGIVIALSSSAIGGLMIALQGHAVGAPDGGAGLPIVNWSTGAGDLRVAHFVGLHALQVLPIIGDRLGTRAATVTALVWAIVTAVTLLQALAGRPLVAF